MSHTTLNNLTVLFLALLALPACTVVTGLGDAELLRATDPELTTTPTIIANESYAGLVGDIELAAVYSAQNSRFVGRVRNESLVPVCNIKVRVFVDNVTEFDEPIVITSPAISVLNPRGRHSFALDAPATDFSSWIASIELGECSSDQLAASLRYQPTSDGSHEENERDESPDHEGERLSGEYRGNHVEEGDEEAGPSIPISQAYRDTHQSLVFDVAFDSSRGMFQGHVTNIGSRTVCRARVEIHIKSGNNLVELGPTIPVHLAPQETIHFVLDAGDRPIGSYWIHPERSRCR